MSDALCPMPYLRMELPQTILVCDDEAHIRHVITHRLRTSGFTVREARNGQEGLDAVLGKEALRPDLIITDFQMPMLSGLEMCAALKIAAPTCETPALMLTARGYVLTPEDLARTNIRQVVSKPFGVRQLLDRVLALLPSRPSTGREAA